MSSEDLFSSAEILTNSARPGRWTPNESNTRASVRFWSSTVVTTGATTLYDLGDGTTVSPTPVFDAGGWSVRLFRAR